MSVCHGIVIVNFPVSVALLTVYLDVSKVVLPTLTSTLDALISRAVGVSSTSYCVIAVLGTKLGFDVQPVVLTPVYAM